MTPGSLTDLLHSRNPDVPREALSKLAEAVCEMCEEARSAAFEEAAKIAEHNDHIDCMAAKAIASAIRQHAKGEGK